MVFPEPEVLIPGVAVVASVEAAKVALVDIGTAPPPPGEFCWGKLILGLWVSERGLEAATTEATCLFVVGLAKIEPPPTPATASPGNPGTPSWFEFERGLEGFLSGVSALRPLLWDLKLAGVKGLLALRLPVKDLVAEIGKQ